MKLQFKTIPTIVPDEMVGSKMSLAEGNADMFAYYFRSKIYTDKILAPIRETICNGWDEHVKYNVQQPLDIKITVQDGEHIWSCRDYAKGLSKHDVENVFGMYGASKKRENAELIGGFGVGAASPHAYGDTFYITSYFEGTKTQYACMLVAGDNGIEVGKIYEVHSEPTTETGLEVSFDISKDYWSFGTKTSKFVRNFLPDSNVIFHVDGDLVTPLVPLDSKVIGDFTIHKYATDFDSNPRQVAIRMGGVVYQSSSVLKLNSVPKGKIVIDVPIGKLTIPISREDIENTPANGKVLDEIQKILDDLVEQDKSKIVTPKFGAVVLENAYDSQYEGDWFTYSFSSTFPDSWNFKKRINFINTHYNHNIVNGKYLIYMLPDIISWRSWVKRLEHFVGLTMPNTQIMWLMKREDSIPSTPTLDLSDVIFLDVKKLGLPKLPKKANEASYLMFFQGYKKGSFTAEDLDEDVTTNYFNGVDLVDGWEKTINDSNIIKRRVVGLTGDYGTSNYFWTTNSKKMFEQLLELGWFAPNDPRLSARIADISKAEEIKKNIADAEYKVKSVLFKTIPSKRTIDIIGKNPDKLTKLSDLRAKLIKEDSPRGRILNSLEAYYPKITREDLRKIMKLK